MFLKCYIGFCTPRRTIKGLKKKKKKKGFVIYWFMAHV